MPRNLGDHRKVTSWTGRALPWTAGNKGIHDEIAQEQVSHWSAKQIKAAERSGYFTDLTMRATRNTRLYLLNELSEEGE